MPTHHQHRYDIVIAGGGPVGLFLACELADAGCRILVLEQADMGEAPLKRLPFGLRGLTLPSMEGLDRRGLLAPLRARMAAVDTAGTAPWTTGARRPAGHFAGLQFFRDMVDEDAWPWRAGRPTQLLAVTIADIEQVLTARAHALDVTIRYGCRVDRVEEHADLVAVHVGPAVVHAAWLVGCDGGRSAVRKDSGIGFAGTEPEFTGYSVALRLDDPDALRPGRQHGAAGMYTYAPPRTVISDAATPAAAPAALTMVDFDRGSGHRTAPLTRDHLQAVLRRVSGTEVSIAAVSLATTWTDRAFLATSYRRGRVLLAGDAAHVHAPLGGQGLNLGLGDAMNLGRKLAAVTKGDAPPSLLDSYERERRPVAERVMDWSRAQVALLRPDRGTAALRAVVRDLMETRDGATYFAGRLWGVDLPDEPPLTDRH